MLENLPHMLGIEPYMIKSNTEDHDRDETDARKLCETTFLGTMLPRQQIFENNLMVDVIGFLNFGETSQM